MSKPLTADELINTFKIWGVKFREDPGWRTRNRDGHGGNERHGLVIHHTGFDASPADQTNLLRKGRSDLPGPLCTWGQTASGIAIPIGNGRANHAGTGSAFTLRHVMNEDYPGYKTEIEPGNDQSIDGNAHFYGEENFRSGTRATPVAQMRNSLLAAAAICDAHGWTAKSVIGHREWTSRKPDPGLVNMAEYRSHVRELLNVGPKKAQYRK